MNQINDKRTLKIGCMPELFGSAVIRIPFSLSFFIACFGLLNLNIIRKKF